MGQDEFDAVIIGSGMGGMCAAARLTGAGKRVLVLEKSPYLGGRCSHRVRSDCVVTTGAVMIPMGSDSAIREAFDAVGAEMDMIDLTGRMRYRLRHGDYDTPPEGGGLIGMIEFAMKDGAQAKALFREMMAALGGDMPPEEMTTQQWFDQRTDNPDVKDLFRGFCAALMGTNLHEIPAAEFFRFLGSSSKGSRFGMTRLGNGALMDTLAEAITARGSEIRRQTRCEKIIVENGRVAGVVAHGGEGGEQRIVSPIVVSNAGPDETATLAGGEEVFDEHYRARLNRNAASAPIFHISFVMDRPLIEGFEGCMVFGNNENLIYLEIPSAISPETISPEGTFLHIAYGAPSDAANSDLTAEFENTMRELEANFPGVTEEATFLVKAKHSGRAPGMHRWPGFGMPSETSVAGLYNVGDGCIPPGTIGTEGAAASARVAVAQILATH